MRSLVAALSWCLVLPCAAQGTVRLPPAATPPQIATLPEPAAPPQVATPAEPGASPQPSKPSQATTGAALPSPAATPPRRGGEPEVVHTVIEGETTRIDELKVRSVPQRIVVTTTGRLASTYEIITGDGSRDLSPGVNTSRGAAGKPVWRVLNF